MEESLLYDDRLILEVLSEANKGMPVQNPKYSFTQLRVLDLGSYCNKGEIKSQKDLYGPTI